MFVTNGKQSEMNAFKSVRAPRPRDLFRQVGESLPSNDSFSCTAFDASAPQRPFVSIEEYSAWVQSEAKRLRDSEASPSRNAGDSPKGDDKPSQASR